MNKASVHSRIILLVLSILLVNTLTPVAQADVLISELCDPRYDYLTDRYIEIWNSGPSAVDLTGWQLTAIGNGSEIFTWNLSGTIAVGQALVAGDLTTADVFQVDFPEDAWSSNNSTWNGSVNDGARLRNGSGVIVEDIVVPGSNFENDTMVRNEGITSPVTTFNLAEWTSTPVYLPSEATPGVHWTLVGDGPVIGTIATAPVAPMPGETVDVQAVITEATATITSVTLNWGTASGSLTNAISMTNIGGDTFETVTPIPAQVAGLSIFYAVTAGNDIPAETVSDEMSYTLPYVLTVQDIQGVGSVSPYVGINVTTTGVVTADYGTAFVIQNGTGIVSGLWVTGAAAPALGTEVEVSGLVEEIDSNTTLSGAVINSSVGGVMPAALNLTTGMAGGEDYEGVLVRVIDATCTVSQATTSHWEVENSGGAVSVTDMAVAPGLVLGTQYTIIGPQNGSLADGGIAPRTAADIIFVSDAFAPTVLAIDPLGPTSIRITFSETVELVSSQSAANYTLAGGTVSAASPVSGEPTQIELTVSTMIAGQQTLTFNGVEDSYGNAMSNVVEAFSYYGGNIPTGYYDTAEGLIGETLRLALHNIIDNHYVSSYDGLYAAYYTTDDKDNGKVWDMYSDVPDGIPPYEYDFGVDEGGDAGAEGTGYNREHSWPSSWYGGSGVPYTDIFMVVPSDNRVNNMRSNYPYGETTTPDWVSLNGSKRGPCTYPGYTGAIFEPIDAYKGDFARAYFYMSTRYYTEDAGWPGSPMVSGSQLLPWAEALLLEWHAADPVSVKEIDRNEAVYAIQSNRNPFIDRPDFVQKVFQPELSPVPGMELPLGLVLHQNAPNPFNPRTIISYELEGTGPVDLKVFDIGGHLVRTLFSGVQEAGQYQEIWRGRDQAGRSVATGVYFYQLRAAGETETRRMLLAK